MWWFPMSGPAETGPIRWWNDERHRKAVERAPLLGIDIGGTKTAVCLADETGRIQLKKRMVSIPERGPEDWLFRTFLPGPIVIIVSGRKLTSMKFSGVEH